MTTAQTIGPPQRTLEPTLSICSAKDAPAAKREIRRCRRRDPPTPSGPATHRAGLLLKFVITGADDGGGFDYRRLCNCLSSYGG
jgi:hypothetical protein